MTVVGWPGFITATIGVSSVPPLTSTATVSADATTVSLLFISIESAPGPFGKGFSGVTTKAPSVLVMAVPTVAPLYLMVTSEPGSARPAMTVSPLGSTRTVSKLGATTAFGAVASAFAGSSTLGASTTGVSGSTFLATATGSLDHLSFSTTTRAAKVARAKPAKTTRGFIFIQLGPSSDNR